MAHSRYMCNLEFRKDSGGNAIKSYMCMLECCYCKTQYHFAVQRRSPRRLWEDWYVWLGVTLLVAFVVPSVSILIKIVSHLSAYLSFPGISLIKSPFCKNSMYFLETFAQRHTFFLSLSQRKENLSSISKIKRENFEVVSDKWILQLYQLYQLYVAANVLTLQFTNNPLPLSKSHRFIPTIEQLCNNNYMYNVQDISFRHNAQVNGNWQNNREFNQQRTDRDQISISVIPTAGTFWSQGKVLVIGGQPSITHMSKRKPLPVLFVSRVHDHFCTIHSHCSRTSKKKKY